MLPSASQEDQSIHHAECERRAARSKRTARTPVLKEAAEAGENARCGLDKCIVPGRRSDLLSGRCGRVPIHLPLHRTTLLRHLHTTSPFQAASELHLPTTWPAGEKIAHLRQPSVPSPRRDVSDLGPAKPTRRPHREAWCASYAEDSADYLSYSFHWRMGPTFTGTTSLTSTVWR
jgi:hypothetical protein